MVLFIPIITIFIESGLDTKYKNEVRYILTGVSDRRRLDDAFEQILTRLFEIRLHYLPVFYIHFTYLIQTNTMSYSL